MLCRADTLPEMNRLTISGLSLYIALVINLFNKKTLEKTDYAMMNSMQKICIKSNHNCIVLNY